MENKTTALGGILDYVNNLEEENKRLKEEANFIKHIGIISRNYDFTKKNGIVIDRNNGITDIYFNDYTFRLTDGDLILLANKAGLFGGISCAAYEIPKSDLLRGNND